MNEILSKILVPPMWSKIPQRTRKMLPVLKAQEDAIFIGLCRFIRDNCFQTELSCSHKPVLRLRNGY